MADRAIWKYLVPFKSQLYVADSKPLSIPMGFRFVHVGMDPGPTGQCAVWVEVDPEQRCQEVRLVAVGTGSSIPGNWDHVGSVVSPPFAWHVYRILKA